MLHDKKAAEASLWISEISRNAGGLNLALLEVGFDFDSAGRTIAAGIATRRAT